MDPDKPPSCVPASPLIPLGFFLGTHLVESLRSAAGSVPRCLAFTQVSLMSILLMLVLVPLVLVLVLVIAGVASAPPSSSDAAGASYRTLKPAVRPQRASDLQAASENDTSSVAAAGFQ